MLIVLLSLLVGCGDEKSPNQPTTDNGSANEVRTPANVKPEEDTLRSEIGRVAVFRHQLKYFYNYYGRVPSSFEEWRDSGFLIFTPWSGSPVKPSPHTTKSPLSESDPLGTFHYEALGPKEFKLELVREFDGERMVVTYQKDFKEWEANPMAPIKPGQTYMEAKADAYWELLDIIWVRYNPDAGNLPTSLLDMIDGYVSLVPEGFSIPEGVNAKGDFEFGIDLTNGYQYSIQNLQRSMFARGEVISYGMEMEESFNSVSDNRLVLFSSDLLKAGYPELTE